MRLSEWLLAAAVVITLISLIVGPERRSRWLHLMPWVTLGLLGYHLLGDGFRWQLEFVYGYALLLCVPLLGNVRLIRPSALHPPRNRRLVRTVVIIVGLVVLGMAGWSCYRFPLFDLPTPSGEFAVGTRYLYITDQSRPDDYTVAYDDFRKISLQIWYPAAPGVDAQPVGYLSVEAGEYMAESYGLPSYSFSHLESIPTHSYLNAPAATGGKLRPLILYSPSHLMTACVALAEEMASRGYVFVAVGHPHWNAYYFDNNGAALPGVLNDDHYEAMIAEFNSDAALLLRKEITSNHDTTLLAESEYHLNRLLMLNRHDVVEWTTDLSLVIDTLFALSESGQMPIGKLDPDRIGAVGLAKGGCAAAQACLTEPRVQCGIDLDGFLYGDIIETNLTKPFLFMHGEPSVPQAYITELFYERSESTAYRMKIWGARHDNFSDVSLYGGFFRQEDKLGSIDGDRCVEIQNAYITSFFDKHLRGFKAPLMESQSPAFPEVEFMQRDGRTAAPTQTP